ncbi:[acyl-carrier-protein] S-malonyltransferase [Breznakia sp. PF5-3]|uniref:ACP S-malonyltransferase n=1 Tax=unclassified Breznakia TaxID=2623764 RepID=UPI002405627E|nr:MULTISPECIES: ACP S-malonyltransferase [unclassified Breznakia]MDF9824712.1 [acyl-carrier-protein] S-malonyltransferase [Breznakia sp. PM6-1]MDF9835375.1 [acyl-carrier-protein] S-malonyltransferase [Breznakia sp. PF5-3]MDF9836974.1 [acyl-carrier-protein] S-malonyltransferase [Breznakia sp. PFB2-8]MDF9859610.1 [acyl-carrier-protein] S-malonyltransferase [Breznakia sp. PH5-24]
MKIGYLFAGQGSQYVGMGKDLYEKYPEAKQIYEQVKLDFDVKEACFEGPEERLNDTAYAQSCILVTSMAIAEVVKAKGIIPEYVAGLSLGEYSALCYAEAFDVNTAANITRMRGQIMANALPKGTTGMAAILNLDEAIIKEVCDDISATVGVCEIANYNCPGQIVITGTQQAMEKACEVLLEKGARRAIPLNVSGAFHSSLLEDASLELNKVLKAEAIQKPNIKVVYNISGKEENDDVVNILTKQIKSSVYFMQSIQYMIDQGVDTFIEIGPGSALKGFVRKVNRDVKVYSVDTVETLDKMLEEVKNNG